MSDQPPIDRSQFFDQIGFGFADDGRVVELRFKRKNGKVAYVPCNFSDLSALVLHIEKAAGQAWELQTQALGGTDPRLMQPIRVHAADRFQGARSTEGKPLISVVLKTGLRLELSIPEDDIPELILWLEELQASRSKPRRPRH
jgi:hypothetical protein